MSSDQRHDEFMRLFLACEPKLFAYIRSLLFSRADADDVLQETARVLWAKFDEFERGTHFDRWAYRTAHLQVMYHRQKMARSKLRFSDVLVEKLATEVAPANDRLDAARDALANCLGKLKDVDREMVHKRFQEDMTNRDIARGSGRSESAVSRALSRIYLSLLQRIENTLRDEKARARP